MSVSPSDRLDDAVRINDVSTASNVRDIDTTVDNRRYKWAEVANTYRGDYYNVVQYKHTHWFDLLNGRTLLATGSRTTQSENYMWDTTMLEKNMKYNTT